MVEFKWIKISLFLTAVLQYTAAAEKHPLSLSVAVGDEVTLLCENVIDDQQNCDNTDWYFRYSRYLAELFENGKIHNDSRAKSDRLSLTANCSLVIKKVTVEDTGRYSCRQFNKSGYQQGRDSEVYLSVISMTEHKETDLVTLGCSVSTFGRCRHTVRWLFNGQDWDRHNRNVKTDQPSCYASLNFLTFCYNNASNYNLLKCEVKDPGPSGEDITTTTTTKPPPPTTTTTTTITTKPPTTTNPTVINNTSTNPKEPWMRTLIIRSIIVSVGLAALIIAVVAVNIWTKTKGKQMQTDENMVDNDEDDGTVNYENTRSSDV
ncbi:uncharacterized protein LOC127364513 [Dicentrarchus labrax]|uniref:uncharacterized protein LOC127364513 n=1 Tax=Dicentrarchus labrax TaxID=13489 RepID=UPI0021F5356E|nr:uncharacterized protein LOC127364513 [Dicentrarchus labrax]